MKITQVLSTCAFWALSCTTLIAIPVVDEIMPTGGSVLGDNRVIIKGSGFSGAFEIKFGDIRAKEVLKVTDTEIIALAPLATTQGIRPITVRTYEGISTPGLQNEYQYIDIFAPTISEIIPSKGSVHQATVIIKGSDFDGTLSIKFGEIAAPQIHYIMSNEIQVDVPSNVPGTCYVTVTTSLGTSPINASCRYTYLAE